MKETQEKIFYDLTNPQDSIYMSEAFYGDQHIFIIPAWAMIKKDNINYELLEKAINNLVKRNDVLRTRFLKNGDTMTQYFEDYSPFDVQKIVVNDIDELEEFIKGITFDIYSSTPVKFLMFENLSGYGGFCCIAHHLISDAWSHSIILEEVLKDYNSMVLNKENSSYRTSSYKDFINSEEEYLKSDKFKKDKEYWEDKFSSSSEILSLKSSNSFETDSIRKSFNLPEIISKHCIENKISIFSFFYAIISIYFSRIENTDDIIIGTPYLNRTNFKEKNTLGMFISTLPFKNKIDDNQSIADYIKDIAVQQIGGLRHQKYPFAELQKYYTKKFGRTSNLYDILFSYQNAKADSSNLDFEFESKWIFTNHQVESLVINISDIDGTNAPIMDYDFLTSVFNEDDISTLHSRLIYMAEQMITTPNILVKDLEIVTPDERDILINKFNDTSVAYDRNNTIATLFSSIAKSQPNDIALVFEDKELTYKELDEKSNYLADILIKAGAKRNTFIGVLFNRSLEMIISILAVLKSGAAYMPINPDYPDERIGYMIDDSKCKLLLRSEDMTYHNSSLTDIIVKYDELSSKDNWDNISKADDLAYVIYTSGSTGKPKGVMIRHYSIINTLLWRKSAYNFDKNISVLQIPSFAFDSSVEDIFTPLISGAKLVLINQSNSNFDISLIRQLIIKHNINHMLVVPSFYNVLLNEISDVMTNFKSVTVAGEGFAIELVKKHFEILSNVEIFNEYGPTENSVCTTFHKFDKNDSTVFIGKPINNCSCYILNNNLKVQPFNVKGELYVSGPGLAKGYIGRQDLTDTRFIPSPFKENTLMYKTGDVVSINEEGLMTFHERVDYQVKYNGFRINLGEIESAISKYTKNPNVVALLKHTENTASLAAYIETKNNIDIKELKQDLKKFLPYYMIPQEIDIVKKFPLTPNGKIDRKALEKLYIKPKDNIVVAPRNELDEKILQAWKKVLKQENIGIDDNIFELGGDSLSIISIQSVLFKNDINVKSQVLFENPTIRAISDYISNSSNTDFKNDMEIFSHKPVLLDDINKKSNEPTNILLTGATGFLGSHILAEIINTYPNVTLYCVIRNKPNKNYKDRLKEILHFYFGEKYDLLIGDKIIPIDGDLVRDNLGIDVTLYKTLIGKIDYVINGASLVKHFGDYNLFYNSNVVTVKNLIKFAKEANATLNHISTTSVSGNYLVQNDIEYDFTENDFYIGQNYKDNVYVRTKFEAENEIFKAQNEGLKVNIFRIGNLMQRVSDGKFQINKFDNAYFKRIYGFIKLGKLPSNLSNQELEFTPVDSCARAIVKLMTYENKVFHLLNNNLISITNLIHVLHHYNVNIEFISPEDFLEFIHNEKNHNYLENFITDLNNSKNLNYDTKITINDNLTREYLKHNSFTWPNITNEYLDLFIKNILEDTNEKEKI